MRCIAIIPAAGSGSRFGGAIPKQFLTLAGRPLVAHSIERFLDESDVDRVIVAVAARFLDQMQEIAAARHWRDVTILEGGASRQESVTRALRAVRSEDRAMIAVHDAVRPFFRSATFRATLAAAEEHGAAIPVISLTDTIHRVQDGFVAETPDRSLWFAAQTPQCFRAPVLRRALEQAGEAGLDATDEAGAVRRSGMAVRVVAGDPTNIKITREDDLRLAELNFEQWSRS